MQRARHARRAHAAALRSPVLPGSHRPPVRAVDSITTSSTSRSTSQSASFRRSAGWSRPSGVQSGTRRRSRRRPRRPPASSCGRQFLRSGTASGSLRGARASSRQSGSRAIVVSPSPRRSIIRSITHAPDQTVARPHCGNRPEHPAISTSGTTLTSAERPSRIPASQPTIPFYDFNFRSSPSAVSTISPRPLVANPSVARSASSGRPHLRTWA